MIHFLTRSIQIKLVFLVLVNALLSGNITGCKSTDTSSSVSTKPTTQLTIAAAANMQFAINELVDTFSDHTSIPCQVIIGSSGKLAAQIREGAPFDIFVSADMKYPMSLFDTGSTLKPPKVYAYGKLVIWSMCDYIKVSDQILTHVNINRIAIANPQTSPYGLAAMQALKNYDVYDEIKAKLVFGESISQTNQFILSQAVEVGFTAKSVVLSKRLANQGQWVEVSTSFYEPIAQGMVIIDHKFKKSYQTQQFSEFLFSVEAKTILEKFGYVTSNLSGQYNRIMNRIK